MADMKPEEVANLANLYASLNEQLLQLQTNIEALRLAGKEKTAEYLDLASKEKEANLAAMEAQLKLLDNMPKFEQSITANDKALQKEIEKLILREQTLEAQSAAMAAAALTDDVIKAQKAEKDREILEIGEIIDKKQIERREAETKNEKIKQEANKRTIEELKLLIEEERKILDLKKATDSLTASLSQQMIAKAGISTSYVDYINVAGKAGGVTGMMGSIMQSSAASFKAALNPVNLLSSAIAYAVENFQQFYNAILKVGREAGTTVASGLDAAYASGARLGIDMGSQAATANALATSFVNLGNKTSEQTETLLIASYQMQRFGIGANESITILSGFQRSLGLSSEESAKLATELVSTARGLGLTSDAVKGLANNMEQFIAYGSQANQVMKETLAVSSQFGIGTDAIAKMSTKLDSLEGSITAANTIARELGVALDPLQLLRANPAEKMQMVADAIERSGFEGENARFKIQVLADQLGLTASQVQALTKQTEQSTGMLGDFEKGIRDLEASLGEIGGSLDGLEQIKIFFQNIGAPLMLFLGLINGILGVIFSLVNGLIAWADETNVVLGFVIKLILFLGVAKLAIGGFGGMISWLTGMIGTGLSKALAATGAGFSSMITSMGTAATASAAGVGPLMAFGFAILMIGAGIGAAAWGMSKFVEAFKGFSGGQIMAIGFAIIALGAAFWGFSTVIGALMTTGIGWAMIGFLFAFSIALIPLVIMVSALADSMTKLSNSFKGFKDSGLSEFVAALKDLADVEISAKVGTNIRTIYTAISEGETPTAEKIKAIVDISSAVKVYSDATKTFSESGGPTAAQVMTDKFVESMTTISEKIITTQTSTGGGGGMAGGGNITIVLDDVVIMKGKLKNIMDENASEKLTGG